MDTVKLINPSVTILMITGLAALAGVAFIIAVILISENRLYNNDESGPTGPNGQTGPTGPIDFFCTSPGPEFRFPPPAYERSTPKTTATGPLSVYQPKLHNVTHTVQKSHSLRSITNPVSPNHWIGNTFFQSNGIFNCYPYSCRAVDDGLYFAWPTNGELSMICNHGRHCVNTSSDLIYNINSEIEIKLGSITSNIRAMDILDVDPLVSTVAWSYNFGVLKVYFAKGSPFITGISDGLTVSLELSVPFTMIRGCNKSYIINFANKSDGYLIFLSNETCIEQIEQNLYIPSFDGVFRIGYFNNHQVKTILNNNYNTYPVESTIDVQNTHNIEDGIWDVRTEFKWSTRTMYNDTELSDRLLMVALPHHNITNIQFVSRLYDHELIGPYRYIITQNNTWRIDDGVADFAFEYPPISNNVLNNTWKADVNNITRMQPNSFINWCKWLGSLANLILLGRSIKHNVDILMDILKCNLRLISYKEGNINNNIELVIDDTWGGVINRIGLRNCSGNSDNGNAFYNNHVGQYGYLLYAYAVIGRYDVSFADEMRDIALFIARDIVNPSEYDNIFPLWRNKDWYLGYSITSGLSPMQSRGKITENIGDIIMGYYASYLLGVTLNDAELIRWSVGLLSSEINALQYYFQFSSHGDIINVDPEFIQGTISKRGDTLYEYTVDRGNINYPARTASIMVPMIKPLTLMSFDYINYQWANLVNGFLTEAINQNDIEAESYAYAAALMAVNGGNNQQLMRSIMRRSGEILPYGSTWSSIQYWIINQETRSSRTTSTDSC